jgi:phosphatidylglycerol:prolipoprotein diacylglycerol transferase
MRPILFHLPDWLGGAAIPSYGVFMGIGFLSACLVFAYLVKISGKDGGKAFELMLETMLVAIVASKVVGIIFQDFGGDVSMWERLLKTGGVWYVGFLAGVAWMLIRGRSLGLATMSAIDCAAVAIPVGHAFGRLGCFLAGCCFGGRCDLPWAVTFTSELANQHSGTPIHVPLHPVQLYEMTSEFLLAGFLAWWFLKKSRYPGQTGLLYLIVYALVRFSLEFLREDHRGGLGAISTSQAIALMILAVTIPAITWGVFRGSPFPKVMSTEPTPKA